MCVAQPPFLMDTSPKSQQSQQSQDISAVGRTINQLNADRLSKAFVEIGKTLISAGVLDLNTAYNLLKDEISASQAEISAAIDRDDFKLQVEIATWTDRFRRIIDTFKTQFLFLHNWPDESLIRVQEEKSLTREDRIAKLIQDLRDLLTDLSAASPAKGEDAYWLPHKNYYSDFEMGASNNEDESDEEAIESESITEIKTDGESELEIAFECPTVVADIAASASNRYPVKGVLFRIDEPSEAIPAVGTGLPLYIPREVAVTLLDKVNGLPLDADDSLTRHANKEIAGVIQSARIGGDDDRDFWIQGILWPWNQKEKVEAISAASTDNKLGMSMNAKALGHKALVEGKQVFWIDDIELLGANILYSDCATYRKTKLLAAQGVTVIELPGSPIAAQAIDEQTSTNYSEGENKPVDTNIANIQGQLTSLITSIDAMTKQNQTQFETLTNKYSELSAAVSEIQAERHQQKEEFQLQQQQQQQRQQQENLVSSLVEQISAAVNAQVDEKFKKLKNPSGQPARLTTPLAASAAAPMASSELHQIDLQIASLNGRLEEASNDMSKTLKLMDEKRQLEYKRQLITSA